jgi:hypothetical protein
VKAYSPGHKVPASANVIILGTDENYTGLRLVRP